MLGAKRSPEMERFLLDSLKCVECGATKFSESCSKCRTECTILTPISETSRKLLTGNSGPSSQVDKKTSQSRDQNDDLPKARASRDAGIEHFHSGRPLDAEKCFTKARKIYMAAHGDKHETIAGIDMLLGHLYQTQARYSDALMKWEESLRIYSIKGLEKPLDAGVALSCIGLALFALGRHKEALSRHRLAQSALVGYGAQHQPMTAGNLAGMARSCHELGDFVEAAKMHEAALCIFRLHGQNHMMNVAEELHGMGMAYKESGMLEEAAASFREGLSVRRSVWGEMHPIVAGDLHNIGSVLEEQGKNDEAFSMFQASLQVYDGTLGSSSREAGLCLSRMGHLLYNTIGDFGKALEIHCESMRILRLRSDDRSQLDAADELQAFAVVYRRQGMLMEAAANLRMALEIQGRIHGDRHANVGVLACTLAHVFFDQNLLEEALEMFKKAMKIYVSTLGKDCWDAGCICENMGLIKARQGKHAEALPLYQKAIGIYNRVHGVDKATEYAAGMNFSAAFSLFRMGDRDGTLRHLRESMRIYTLLGISDVISYRTARILAQIEGCR